MINRSLCTQLAESIWENVYLSLLCYTKLKYRSEITHDPPRTRQQRRVKATVTTGWSERALAVYLVWKWEGNVRRHHASFIPSTHCSLHQSRRHNEVWTFSLHSWSKKERGRGEMERIEMGKRVRWDGRVIYMPGVSWESRWKWRKNFGKKDIMLVLICYKPHWNGWGLISLMYACIDCRCSQTVFHYGNKK